MTSTITKSKSEHLFAALDVDNDGVISGDDFEEAAERIIMAFQQETSPEADKLRQCYAQVWQDLATRTDTDRSGQVTMGEFEEVFSTVGMGDAMRVVEAAAEAEFALADTDNDGVLAIDELIKMFVSLRVPPTEAMEAIQALDTDRDGHVSRAEYVAAVREFYNSQDPSSPASRLFGRVRG